MQKIALVLAGVQALKQFVLAGRFIHTHPGIVASGNFFGTQAHGVVQEGLELDFGVAQNVGVGGSARLVFAQEFGKHPVFVLGGKVDVFDLNADYIRHRSGVYKVNIGGAVFAVVVILPIFHEDADDFIALCLQQIGGDRRIDPATQAHYNALLTHVSILGGSACRRIL